MPDVRAVWPLLIFVAHAWRCPCLMVQAGVGLGIMPEGSAAIYKLEGVKVVRLNEEWASRELSVCVRSREGLSTAAGLFLEHVLAG